MNLKFNSTPSLSKYNNIFVVSTTKPWSLYFKIFGSTNPCYTLRPSQLSSEKYEEKKVSEVPHFVINSTPSLSKFRMIKIRVNILNRDLILV